MTLICSLCSCQNVKAVELSVILPAVSQKLHEGPNITRKLLILSETKIFPVSRKAVGLRNQSIAFLVDLFSENHYNIDMIKNGKMKID